MTPASIGARIAARLLDEIIVFGPVVVGGVASTLLAVYLGEDALVAYAPLVLSALVVLALFAYQMVRLVRTGQTLGKKVLKIRVVRLDGGRATLGAHAIRGLVLGLLGPISLALIFRADRRCLHDLAAETQVVRV